MPTPALAILFLTRGRPGGLVAAVQGFHALASGDIPVSYVICCDDDDTTLEASLPLLADLPVIVSRNPRPDALGEAWNKGALAAIAAGFEWTHALLTGDDTVPLALHWDRVMASEAHRPAFAWQELNDPLNVTYPVISRAWFRAVDHQPAPAWFPYWFNDTWLNEVHMLAFGAPMPVLPALPMGGRRGTTREMREPGFWFGVFAATRAERVLQAEQLAWAHGQEHAAIAESHPFFAAWDAEQRSRVPFYIQAFGADQVPPTPRYQRLRAAAQEELDHIRRFARYQVPQGAQEAHLT